MIPTDPFETRAREILDATRRYAGVQIDIDKKSKRGGTVILKSALHMTFDQALAALLSLHQTEVKRAVDEARIESEMDKLKAAVDSIHEFVATHNGSEHSISNYLDWLREQKRLVELERK